MQRTAPPTVVTLLSDCRSSDRDRQTLEFGAYIACRATKSERRPRRPSILRPSENHKEAHMTPTEKFAFLHAVDQLDDRQKSTLYNFSAKQLEGTRYTCGCDLLSEAVSRVLEGTRELRTDIPLGAFLYEVMRSILSIDTRRPQRKPLSFEDWMDTRDDAGDNECNEYTASPEEMLMRRQEEEVRRETLDTAKNRLAHNKDAMAVFGGFAQEMTPAEIRKAFNLTEKAYKAARAQITKEIQARGRRPHLRPKDSTK